MSKTLEIHRPAQDKAEVACRLSLYDDKLPKPKADLPFRRYCLLKNSSKAFRAQGHSNNLACFLL